MSEMNIQAVLQQIRSVSARIQPPANETPATEPARASFGKLLEQSVQGINQQQKQAEALARAWQLGDPNINLSEVMIASEKAGVAFEAAKQVRNKLVEAYRDIMNMPL